jgi:hypothetical protein
MLRSPPALRVAPFATSRSVNRNISIQILYSDGDNFPEHVMAISRGRFISAHDMIREVRSFSRIML